MNSKTPLLLFVLVTYVLTVDSATVVKHARTGVVGEHGQHKGAVIVDGPQSLWAQLLDRVVAEKIKQRTGAKESSHLTEHKTGATLTSEILNLLLAERRHKLQD